MLYMRGNTGYWFLCAFDWFTARPLFSDNASNPAFSTRHASAPCGHLPFLTNLSMPNEWYTLPTREKKALATQKVSNACSLSSCFLQCTHCSERT